MHIEHLELKNYAGFADFSLDFPKGNLAVFIGENGSGKTSILEAISALLVGGNIKTILPTKWKENINARIKGKINIGKVQRLFEHHYQKKAYLNIGVPGIGIKFTPISFDTSKLITNNCAYHQNIPKPYDITSFIAWYKDLVFYDVYMAKKYKLDYSPKEVVDVAIKTFSEIEIDTEIGTNMQDLKVIFRKKDHVLSFEQLSAGEQKTIEIIGQIINAFVPPLKEDTGNLLDFQGIVLIDEIETHLHPRWQREILPNLTKTFPNVQFIVTTHSPQVISSVPKEAVFLLKDFQAIPVQAFTQGRDTNSLLTEVFDIPIRPVEDMKMLAHFYAAIGKEEVKEAEKILGKMTERWGDLDSEVIKARMDFEELLNEKVLE